MTTLEATKPISEIFKPGQVWKPKNPRQAQYGDINRHKVEVIGKAVVLISNCATLEKTTLFTNAYHGSVSVEKFLNYFEPA